MSLANDIVIITQAVTKEWTKARKAEERSQRSEERRAEVFKERPVAFTEVMNEIMPGAYEHASGGGRYTVSKRHLYYACRDDFRAATNRELRFKYFAALLLQYLNRHPETEEEWKITADPRGTFLIPNADRPVLIPCGTVAIDSYLEQAGQEVALDFNLQVNIQWPSLAAGQRYQAVLYIEKEGFGPMLAEARIAERYDLAILSCKGQSVVAARKLVDHVCAQGGGVPLFVVHDFDKQGFEISQCLTTVSERARECDQVAYHFENEINYTDLGLRLTDVREHGLEGERCRFRGTFAAGTIATREEQAYLRSGRRVELNEFTAPQFIAWLEGKLDRHLPRRLVPADEILEAAWRRATAVAHVNRGLVGLVQEGVGRAQAVEVPRSLRRQLTAALSRQSKPWDQVLYDLAARMLAAEDEDDA